MASTDDILGRFSLAVSSTIGQVIKTLFEDRQAELRQRTERETTQSEIEEAMKKQRKEGF
jgi:hypothetical protein